MGKALRRLLRNLGSLILALLLAVAIWIAATLQADSFGTREYANVPITLVNQPPETIFVEPVSERVAVSVRAPSSVLDELRVTDFEATMDLSTVEPGTPTIVPVQVTTGNEEVRILDRDPTEETVYLEAVQTITVPVTIRVEGPVATGYQMRRPVVSPSQVTVYGAESFVIQVESISGTVNVEEAKEDVIQEVRVTPLDADGELVPGVQWTPDRVEVEVDVRPRLGYKPDVEVVPDLRGEPAPGYRLGSVSVDPSTVTLAGVPSVLDELPGFVETRPISVTDATQDLLELSPLTVPNSVVVIGLDYVTVTVEVLPIQSSRAMTSTVEVQGVRPVWIASTSPNVVDVILEGPDTILTEMTADDIRVIVDVFGLGLGVHRVVPEVLAPAEITVVSIIPETIEVAIAPMPTPTPTLTVTPTMTIEP
jgi:YbbR domain-containing protein